MVERFQMKTEHDWVCARHDPKGDWVRFSDYEALRADLYEQVKRERDGFRDIAARKSDQVAALIKAEAAGRLAGDGVATDEMVECALVAWFDESTAWDREMPPPLRKILVKSMRAAINAAITLKLQKDQK